MALVGGGARLRRIFEQEAAAFAGVVDLDRAAVAVLAGEDVPSEEERVLAVSADRQQGRVVGAEPTRDQLGLAA